MDDRPGSDSVFIRLLRWAKTPPQVYVVYVVCLILVWMVSFYAGTLNPRKAGGLRPPPLSAPKN